MKIGSDDITKTTGAYRPKAVMLLIDEMSEVMSSPNFKLVNAIQSNISSIARLGRAAGCGLVLATQRPSSNVINADLKNNIQIGVLLGDFDASASTLIFDEDISNLSKPEIKGRGFVKSGKKISEFQSYWTEREKDFKYKDPKNVPVLKGTGASKNADKTVSSDQHRDRMSLPDDIDGLSSPPKVDETSKRHKTEPDDDGRAAMLAEMQRMRREAGLDLAPPSSEKPKTELDGDSSKPLEGAEHAVEIPSPSTSSPKLRLGGKTNTTVHNELKLGTVHNVERPLKKSEIQREIKVIHSNESMEVKLAKKPQLKVKSDLRESGIQGTLQVKDKAKEDKPQDGFNIIT